VQLNYWNQSWPLSVDQCPCDAQFVEYLKLREIAGKVIFHFGTGEHHLVGKANLEMRAPNEIFGITASPQEYDSYIRFIIDNPAAARYYKVIFADIYTLTGRIIPDFDLVTLFHICEFYDEQRSAYAQLNDAALLDLFISKLKPGGKILFYAYSGSFDRKTRALIEAFTADAKIVKEDQYKTLLVYGPRSRGNVPLEKRIRDG
jgi:hypothetical protein